MAHKMFMVYVRGAVKFKCPSRGWGQRVSGKYFSFYVGYEVVCCSTVDVDCVKHTPGPAV
jgi:hypothetical protein